MACSSMSYTPFAFYELMFSIECASIFGFTYISAVTC